MAILQLLQQLLTTKATAVIAALTLVGGGAAIAAPDLGDDAAGGDEEPAVESEVEENPEVSLDGLEEQQLQQMADACTEDPDSELCAGDSPDRDENEQDMELAEPSAEEEADAEEVEADEDEDTRSDTARRVHEALTGSDEIVPGNPDFGKTVSERARSGKPGDLGRLVSRAAQGDVLDEDDLKLEKREPKTSTEEADEVKTEDEDDDEVAVEAEDDEAEASGRPEHAGPPADKPGKGRGR